MDFRGRTPRVRHARDGGQRLVVDDHARERVGETIGIVGDDDRERLAHVPRHVAREDGDRPRPALRRCTVRVRQRVRARVEIGGGPCGDDARLRARIRGVDSANARVPVDAANDAEMQAAHGGDVVEEAAGAADEALIGHAARRGADHRARRRARTASASSASVGTVMSQPMHASVMLCP